MKKLIVGIILCFMALIFTGDATADIYQWVDENGVAHISDSPPLQTGSAMKTYKESYHATGNITPVKDGTQNEKMIISKIELYTTSWCPYCKKARKFLSSRGISFTEYDIEKDSDAARRKKILDHRNGVPFAVINGRPIHGFSEAVYEKAVGGQR